MLRIRFLIFFISINQVWAESWTQHQSSLNSTSFKIIQTQQDIHHLVQSKKSAHSKEQVSLILEEIKQKYKTLKDDYRKLQSEKEHVKYDHPEKGDDTQRRYSSFNMPSLEEIESEEMGLDGQLNRFKQAFYQVFGQSSKQQVVPVENPNADSGSQRVPASDNKEKNKSENDENRIKLHY